MPGKDVKLIAEFEEINEYKVTLDQKPEQVAGLVWAWDYYPGDTVELEIDIFNEEFEFDEWTTSSNINVNNPDNANNASFEMPEKDITITANFEEQQPTTMCSQGFDPVCWVDWQTYSNECEAGNAWVDVAHTGSCESAGTTVCNEYDEINDENIQTIKDNINDLLGCEIWDKTVIWESWGNVLITTNNDANNKKNWDDAKGYCISKWDIWDLPPRRGLRDKLEDYADWYNPNENYWSREIKNRMILSDTYYANNDRTSIVEAFDWPLFSDSYYWDHTFNVRCVAEYPTN